MITPRSFSLAAIAVLSTWSVQLQSSPTLAFAPSRGVLSRSVSPGAATSIPRTQSIGLAASAEETDAASKEEESLLSPKDQKVYKLLGELSESELPFRIVVVGNGAIHESTNVLGPTFKLGHSAKTGNPIVTFASEDQSFEFHVMPTQVASAVFVEKESPATGKTMRLIRLLNADGGSISSLILADHSEAASDWFGGMTEKYGSDVVF